MSVVSPPALDELEVTLIGPGYGEAALVHIGDCKWIAIDSCKLPGAERPASIDYLNSIGVDPATAILCVVVTHFDDDHIRGVSETISAADSASIVMSAAFINRDFLRLVNLLTGDRTRPGRSGLDEIRSILNELHRAQRNVKWALGTSTIFEYGTVPITSGETFRMRTLSPAHQEYNTFLDWVRQQMPSFSETRRRLPYRNRNDVSVAVEIHAGSECILLGADLEEEGRQNTGWSAVIASVAGGNLRKASAYKVAHHGSATGYNDRIWSELLTKTPTAILAPWINGGKIVPTGEERTQILRHTTAAYSTTSDRFRRPPRRPSAVERTIKESTRLLRSNELAPGMVRLRHRRDDPVGHWSVALSNGATDLRHWRD